MVRLKDIALRAGVSVMTVSKVLRDAPDISPATKARVKVLAAEMGYVPDSLAQGLRTRTTRMPSASAAIASRSQASQSSARKSFPGAEPSSSTSSPRDP